MKTLFFYSAMLLLSIFFSCNNLSPKETELQQSPISDSQEGIGMETQNSNQQIPLGDPQIASVDSNMKSSFAKQSPMIDWDKKIVKTATLKVEVNDFKKYSENVYKIVRQSGGYIAQEEQSSSPEKSETVITIKVPVYQFEAMMNELPGSESKVIERKINTDDATGKIIDIRSRLETKKEMRQKYLEFLKQSKNMKEVLQVQAEVNNLQEQIEAATSQSNYLTHQSAVSTINLTYYQPAPGFKPGIKTEPSFLNRVASAFKLGGSWIAELFVGLISIWPLIIMIAVSLLFWRKARSGKLLTAAGQISDKK